MKSAIVLSTQPAAFSAVAYKGKVKENLHKIKNAGFDGVELAVRDPKLLSIDEILGHCKDLNMDVCAIGTGQAFGEDGLSLTHPDLSIRKQAIERLITHIDFAEQFQAFVIIGLIRGRYSKDVSKEQSDQWFLEGMIECASYKPNIKMIIEPINRYETDIINTVDGGLDFLKKLQKDNVGLLLDSFHMNIEEVSITASIIKAAASVFHFHVADSNRWYPGAGHIPFDDVINALKKINYNGYVSAEIMPEPDPDTATVKSSAFFKKAL